jgi:hypothetical protein
MSFDENGFFDEEIQRFSSYIENKHIELFEFAVDLNKYLQKHKNIYLEKNVDYRKVICNCLFIKIINSFQAIIILAKRGLLSEATSLSRTLCEPLYLIQILLLDPEFWRKYLKYSLFKLRKEARIKYYDPSMSAELKSHIISKNILHRFDEKLKDFNNSEFQIQSLAKKANLLHHYNNMYRAFSDQIHSSPNVIFNYAEFDNVTFDVQYDVGPSEENIEFLFLSVFDIILASTSLMNEIYDIKRDTKLLKYRDLWTNLVNSRKS